MKRLALVVMVVVVLGFSSITTTWVWGDHVISTPALTHFLQTDENWKRKELGIGSGWFMGVDNGGKVMSGCAITSAAMVFKAYGCDVDPGRLCDWANQHGAFAGTTGNVSFPALVGYDPAKVKWGGREDWSKMPADLDYLRRQIDKDYLPIVKVRKYGGHWIVLCGYQADDFLILDPLGGYAGESFCDKYGDPARNILACCLYIGTIVPTGSGFTHQQQDNPSQQPTNRVNQQPAGSIGTGAETERRGNALIARIAAIKPLLERLTGPVRVLAEKVADEMKRYMAGIMNNGQALTGRDLDYLEGAVAKLEGLIHSPGEVKIPGAGTPQLPPGTPAPQLPSQMQFARVYQGERSWKEGSSVVATLRGFLGLNANNNLRSGSGLLMLDINDGQFRGTFPVNLSLGLGEFVWGISKPGITFRRRDGRVVEIGKLRIEASLFLFNKTDIPYQDQNVSVFLDHPLEPGGHFDTDFWGNRFSYYLDGHGGAEAQIGLVLHRVR
jgi:hypothetical protein